MTDPRTDLRATKVALTVLLCCAGCGRPYRVYITNDDGTVAHLHVEVSDKSGSWDLDLTPRSTTKLAVSPRMDSHLEIQLTRNDAILDRQDIGYFEGGDHPGNMQPTCIRIFAGKISAVSCENELAR